MTDLLLAGFFIAVAVFCQLWLWAGRIRISQTRRLAPSGVA